jgi:hypothetical protein
MLGSRPRKTTRNGISPLAQYQKITPLQQHDPVLADARGSGDRRRHVPSIMQIRVAGIFRFG